MILNANLMRQQAVFLDYGGFKWLISTKKIVTLPFQKN